MPTEERTSIIKFQGGLNLANTELDAIESPGWCESMTNFEADVRGGYRRIDGFQKLGTTSATIPGVVDVDILSVATIPYFRGVVTVRDGKVWYSTDGITWIQVNKDTSGAFVDEATLAGLSALPRTTTGFEAYDFAIWHNGTDEELIFVDTIGSNPLTRLVIHDNASTIEYKYEEATAADWGGTSRFPSTVAALGDRFLYGKDPANKTTVYYSDLFDPFDMVNGGLVQITDQVEVVRSFRERAIIFGRDSIHSFTDIADPVNEAVLPITTRLGCLAAGSVQEVGGDLLFLSADGLRTLAGTDKLDDIALGATSHAINDIFPDLISVIDTLSVSSVVIRKRGNYRLFFHNKDVNDVTQVGVGGILKNVNGNLVWEWNTFSSMPIWNINSYYNDSGVEKVYHVTNVKGRDNTFEHNTGTTFDGSAIGASFKVSYLVLGDPEVRKTLYKMRVYSKGEGVAYNYGFKIAFDTDDANAISPGIYTTDNTLPDSTYGTGAYATATYGAGSKETLMFDVQGSGKAFDLTFTSRGTTGPFTIQGVSVSFVANGRY
jgi:hypothetical protein